MGLDILDREKLLKIISIIYTLQIKRHNWSIPKTRKEGHLFLVLNSSLILFKKNWTVKVSFTFISPGNWKTLPADQKSILNTYYNRNKTLGERNSSTLWHLPNICTKSPTFQIFYSRKDPIKPYYRYRPHLLQSETISSHFWPKKHNSEARFTIL